MEAIIEVIGMITPAVSQVGPEPGSGRASRTHRRHGESSGTIVIVKPYEPTAAPYTQGTPAFTHASLIRKRVSKLSVPSITTAAPSIISSTLAKFTSATIGST